MRLFPQALPFENSNANSCLANAVHICALLFRWAKLPQHHLQQLPVSILVSWTQPRIGNTQPKDFKPSHFTFCPTEDKTKKADPTNEWYRLFDHGVHVRLRFIILSPVTQWTHRHQRLCLVQNLNGALGDGADPRDPAWPRRIARVGKRLANTAGPKIYPKKWIPLNNELEKLQGLKQINTDSAENLKFHGVCIQSQLYIGGNTHECTQNWLCLPFTLQY